jgi:hypothetical protein
MTTLPKLALIPSGYKASKVYSALPTNGDGDFTFSRTSNATRVNKNGLIETVGSNMPRLDYSDSSCPSLLLEPQRTNLITYSEDFANAIWVKTDASITNNSAIAPDGTLTADTLTATSNSGQVQQVYTGSSATEYVVSFWVKRKTGSGIVNIRSVENINTPITVTDEWTRFNLATTSTSTIIRAGINLSTIGDEVYIWGAQLEEGSYPTSYIPTEGITVTRTVETCKLEAFNGLAADYPLTVFHKGKIEDYNSSSYTFSIFDSGSATRYLGFSWNSSNNFYLNRRNDAVIDSDLVTFNSNKNTIYKVAVSFISNTEAKVYINGALIYNLTSGLDVDYVFDSVLVGQQRVLSDSGFRNSAKEFMIFNEALSDAELISLTTL